MLCSDFASSKDSSVTELDLDQKPKVSSFKFPKSVRILSSGHYKHINRKGIRFFGEQIAITVCQGKSKYPRLGITVSRKYGKAHERNRFKRIIRESFRELLPTLPSHLELNVFPKSKNQDISKQAVLVELKLLICRIHSFSSKHEK